jgi:hypothetical protein
MWGCARAPSWTAAAPQPLTPRVHAMLFGVMTPECMPCSLVCDRGCVRGRGDLDGGISTCERDGHREGKRHLRRRLRWPDRCPHGTAARHPPLLSHCRGMEREGGVETTLAHMSRSHRPSPPDAASRVRPEARGPRLGAAHGAAGRGAAGPAGLTVP